MHISRYSFICSSRNIDVLINHSQLIQPTELMIIPVSQTCPDSLATLDDVKITINTSNPTQVNEFPRIQNMENSSHIYHLFLPDLGSSGTITIRIQAEVLLPTSGNVSLVCIVK